MLDRIINEEDIKILLNANSDIETRAYQQTDRLYSEIRTVKHAIKYNTYSYDELYLIDELKQHRSDLEDQLAVAQRFIFFIGRVKNELESED